MRKRKKRERAAGIQRIDDPIRMMDEDQPRQRRPMTEETLRALEFT